MVIDDSTFHEMLSRLDDALQSKVRLGIMSALIGAGSQDFKGLRQTLELTDGNLASHLSYLERRGYVRMEKSFLGKKPHTEVVLTEEGRLGFRQYIETLAKIVGAFGSEDA